ncbi:resolvase [Pseudomonas syringae pv. actinidiae ICMP 18804]
MYLKNASGAAADRPEQLRLLKDAHKGDLLLIESIDRLSRLPVDDWQKLKTAIDSKGLRGDSTRTWTPIPRILGQ